MAKCILTETKINNLFKSLTSYTHNELMPIMRTTIKPISVFKKIAPLNGTDRYAYACSCGNKNIISAAQIPNKLHACQHRVSYISTDNGAHFSIVEYYPEHDVYIWRGYYYSLSITNIDANDNIIVNDCCFCENYRIILAHDDCKYFMNINDEWKQTDILNVPRYIFISESAEQGLLTGFLKDSGYMNALQTGMIGERRFSFNTHSYLYAWYKNHYISKFVECGLYKLVNECLIHNQDFCKKHSLNPNGKTAHEILNISKETLNIAVMYDLQISSIRAIAEYCKQYSDFSIEKYEFFLRLSLLYGFPALKEPTKRKINRYFTKYQCLAYSDANFEIIVPYSADEVIKESERLQLDNVSYFAQSSDFLVFLRKKSNPDKAYCVVRLFEMYTDNTTTLAADRITGAWDGDCDDINAINFVKRWLKKHNIKDSTAFKTVHGETS